MIVNYLLRRESKAEYGSTKKIERLMTYPKPKEPKETGAKGKEVKQSKNSTYIYYIVTFIINTLFIEIY